MFTASEIRELIKSNNIECFYNDRYWRNLSRNIISSNHNECYLCKQQGKYERATLTHHVKSLKHYPELAYSRTYKDEQGEHIQLMPLCHDCHERIHERGIYAILSGFMNVERW